MPSFTLSNSASAPTTLITAATTGGNPPLVLINNTSTSNGVGLLGATAHIMINGEGTTSERTIAPGFSAPFRKIHGISSMTGYTNSSQTCTVDVIIVDDGLQ